MRSSRLAAALSLLLLLSLLAAPPSARAQASRTVEKTVELPSDGHVLLDSYSGRVDVRTWDRAAVRVEARIEDDDRALVEKTRIRIDAGSGQVEIADEVEDGGGFLSSLFGGGSDHPSVYYTLTVPRRARLTLDAYSSDLRAQNLGGALVVDVYSGDTQVRGLRGPLRADTYSGDVEATGVRGAAVVDTYSGDTEITFEQLSGDCAFDSYSGDVTLHLPGGAGFDLVADLGLGGDFSSDFPTEAFSVEDDVYRGTVGGGGARIHFDTFSGDLRLLR